MISQSQILELILRTGRMMILNSILKNLIKKLTDLRVALKKVVNLRRIYKE